MGEKEGLERANNSRGQRKDWEKGKAENKDRERMKRRKKLKTRTGKG